MLGPCKGPPDREAPRGGCGDETVGGEGEAERLTNVADELQRKLRQTGQPQNYLAEQIEVAEAKRIAAEGRVATLTQSLAEATDQLSAAKGQNEQLLQDLESLLSQRGSLDALRTTLTRLLPPELGPALAEASA